MHSRSKSGFDFFGSLVTLPVQDRIRVKVEGKYDWVDFKPEDLDVEGAEEGWANQLDVNFFHPLGVEMTSDDFSGPQAEVLNTIAIEIFNKARGTIEAFIGGAVMIDVLKGWKDFILKFIPKYTARLSQLFGKAFGEGGLLNSMGLGVFEVLLVLVQSIRSKNFHPKMLLPMLLRKSVTVIAKLIGAEFTGQASAPFVRMYLEGGVYITPMLKNTGGPAVFF